MSDFCQQCSFDVFGEDTHDLAGLCKDGDTYPVLCEGCGYIEVDSQGACVDPTCKIHNPSKIIYNQLLHDKVSP